MGVPTSDVSYTAAMPRREDHEVHKDMWWGHWIKKNYVEGVIWGREKNNDIINIKEKRIYWNLEQEVLDGTLSRPRCGRSCGPVARRMKQ